MNNLKKLEEEAVRELKEQVLFFDRVLSTKEIALLNDIENRYETFLLQQIQRAHEAGQEEAYDRGFEDGQDKYGIRSNQLKKDK